MSAEDVRAALLRVLFDGEFHNLMLVNPEAALKDYNLTDDEKQILSTPNADFYKILGGPQAFTWLFILAVRPVNPSPDTPLTAIDEERVAHMVRNIRSSVGHERFNMIIQLVNQTQLGHQMRSEPLKDE